MNDQENQETQDSGQALAEVQQEAPATSEHSAVDQNVHASEAGSAPEIQAASQPEEPPQEEAPQAEAATETPAPEAASPDAPETGGNESTETQDFSQIMAELDKEAPKSQAPAAGQKVKGKILSIGDEWVFVDLGGKAEGRIAAAELKDAEGNLTVKEGDSIDATITGLDPETGAPMLQRRAGGKGKGKKPAEVVPEIRQAAENNLPLEGLVTGLNKGGAEVQVYGMRAFCPLSQLDLRYVEMACGPSARSPSSTCATSRTRNSSSARS
jgi:predicted RNA-binding protein with RPS1 domain